MTTTQSLSAKRPNEAGEGVISVAIVVLIMSFIGAAMWVTFDGMFTYASQTACSQLSTISGGAGSAQAGGTGGAPAGNAQLQC